MIASMDARTAVEGGRTDPSLPLPGPPEPWAASGMPPLRAGPPYLMTEMIEAEPYLADRVLDRVGGPDEAAARLANAVRVAVAEGSPVVVTGCGTSEHAALGIVDQLTEALRAVGEANVQVRSEQALELALDPIAGGLVIGVSHEGGSTATIAALRAAREAGARTGLITAAAASPAAGVADPELLAATVEVDQSWCHTIAYLSPLVVGASIARAIRGGGPAAPAMHRLLATPLENPGSIEAIARALASVERLIVVGSGADRVAGRELVLKVEEGAALPAAFRELETFLHGHLGGVDERTGLVAIAVDRRAAPERAQRTRQLLAAAREVGMPAAAILSDVADRHIEGDLTPAGRYVVVDEPDLTAPTQALFGATVPLQLLTERLARARGRNPDAIRRDEPRYLAAAEAAEAD